jgi:type IV pilus assembly protein PilY1
MKDFISVISSIIFMMLSLPLQAQTMIEYTHYPLSATQAGPPNILILMDNSKGMFQEAYDGDFDSKITYDGYFDPSARYSYTNNSYFERNAAGRWQGSFLNWLTMRRIDILRKVLIGGKTVANSRNGSGSQQLTGEEDIELGYEFVKKYELGSGTLYPQPSDFGLAASSPVYFGLDKGGIYVGDDPDPFSHYTRKFAVKVQKESSFEPDAFIEGNIAGLVQQIGGKARFGLEVFNEDGEGGKIINPVGDDLNDLIYNIENSGVVSGSPLAESFFEGVRYFMQSAPYYPHMPEDYELGRDNDPYFLQEISRYSPCTQSFVILISDGKSTHDLNIPSVLPGGASGNLRDYDGDGNDPGLYAEGGSDYLDDVALWAHTNDLRVGDQELEESKNITLFTISAFGSGSQLLKDAAKNGGFIDLNDNGVPDLTSEWDSNDDGVPDNYFEAKDGFLLEDKLMQVVTRIFQQAASGSGLTIASNSYQYDATLLQAFFKPHRYQGSIETHWMGFLHTLWIDSFGNIREDTDGDMALVYEEDKIIKFILAENTRETTVEVFSDADGDGKADRNTPDATRSLGKIHPVWEAGERLALKSATNRKIKTFIDKDGDGTVDSGEFINFIPGNSSMLRPYLRAIDDREAADIIKYIRGEEIASYRKRKATLSGGERVWKLGDIVHSTPSLSKHPLENYHLIYGDATYGAFYKRWSDRPLTVFAGANDGMIHAFKGGIYHSGDNPETLDKEEHGWYSSEQDTKALGGIGDERWAYIPHNLLPHLKWLTRKDYTHVDYVDLKPKITDARIFADGAGKPIDSDHPEGWGTVLIGGMGLGGGDISITDDFGLGESTRSFHSAYFALDITIPESPRLLWEFTHPALAFTTSHPAVVRVEASKGVDHPEDDKWFVLFGSGPTDYQGTSNQPASMFVVDLKTGKLAYVFEGEEENGFMSNPISIDANLDFNTEVIYVAESYFSKEEWQGKVYRLSTKICAGDACKDPDRWSYTTDPRKWTLSTLFKSPQPITAAPSASLDEQLNLWIYFGTGRYYNLVDRLDTASANYFFGMKDPCYQGNCTEEVLFNKLYNSNEVMVYQGGEVSGAAATNWNDFVDEVQKKEGWFLTLSFGGERIITKPGLLGGTLIFTAYIPDDDICGTGGTSNIYTLYYQTGTAWKKSMKLLERQNTYGDGEESRSEKSERMKEKARLQKGLSSSPVIHVGNTITILSGNSNTMIKALTMEPVFKVRSGMESWRE